MTWRDIYDAGTCPSKSTVEYLDALQDLVPMQDRGIIIWLEMTSWLLMCADKGLVLNDAEFSKVDSDLKRTRVARRYLEE